MKGLKGTAFLALGALFFLSCVASAALRWDVRAGCGVTELQWLSDYNPHLKDTEYDAPIYVMRGSEKGAALLAFAGTHAREVGGPLSLTVLLENGRVKVGTLFVIPCLNSAAMAVADELGQVPHELKTRGRYGSRIFYYGDRLIPLRPGEKDPEHFVHWLGYTHKNGAEWRNVNRNYPGVADGTPAQQVCWAVMELIRRGKIASCLDVHEATAPESVVDPRDGKNYDGGELAYSLITHPKYVDWCFEMIMALETRGVRLKAEVSAPGFRGISHYEIGEATDCIPFLSETPNPAQNEHAVGVDALRDSRHPIEERVGIVMEILEEWFARCEDFAGAPFVMEGLPSKGQIEGGGLANWLN
ncbi:MAG: deacylase [Pyramidobacter sp.]|jgi:hypothetical protein